MVYQTLENIIGSPD